MRDHKIRCLMLIKDSGHVGLMAGAALAESSLVVENYFVATTFPEAVGHVFGGGVDLVMLHADGPGGPAAVDAFRVLTDAALVVFGPADQATCLDALRRGADEYEARPTLSASSLRACVAKALCRRDIRRAFAGLERGLSKLSLLADHNLLPGGSGA